METASSPTIIKTAEGIHQQHAQALAGNLQQLGHKMTSEEITPVTAETSVSKSAAMDALGVEVVGEDLSHIVTTTLGDLTTGSTKTRITPSNRFLSKFLEKLNRKKAPNQQVVAEKGS
jgi:hypothetical protein